MNAKCTKCNLIWNVSVKKDLREAYICPHCRWKERNEYNV